MGLAPSSKQRGDGSGWSARHVDAFQRPPARRGRMGNLMRTRHLGIVDLVLGAIVLIAAVIATFSGCVVSPAYVEPVPIAVVPAPVVVAPAPVVVSGPGWRRHW